MGYENAKIYKLWCIETDLIYIGSTCNPLCKRLYEHKNRLKYSSKKLFELSNEVKIELVEEYPCKNRMELNKKEGEHIRLNKEKCVNLIIPDRTRKEWEEDNKESIKVKRDINNKKYREANREIINLKKKEYHKVNKEKEKEYYEANKEKLNLRKKEYHQENKEKINLRHRENYKAKKDKKINLS